MLVNESNEFFKTRARIIQQLGEQLIRNESIALLELIKNSYDADAEFCNVSMKNPDEPEIGKIIIIDNGSGMSYETIVNSWLEIGTNIKDELRSNPETELTKKFHRRRLGEKGIGRFGVHKLGDNIKLITKTSSSKNEVVVDVDWGNINNSQYIEEIPVSISKRDPVVFTKENNMISGTYIEIKKLRNPWTRRMARDTARTITSLNSPFESHSSFNVKFQIKNYDWLEGLISFEDIETYSLFSFNITMKSSELVDFVYKFTPWNTMEKLSGRIVTIKDKIIRDTKRIVDDDGNEIDLSQPEIGIGKIEFKGVIFDRDPKILNFGVQDKQGLKRYLDRNGGVRVFRDNMRILDYGEPGNDWLSLDSRRVNLPAKRISNNIILASVLLDKNQSYGLKEKANREGFIEDNSYKALQNAIRFALDRIETLRAPDKAQLRSIYSPKNLQQPVIAPLNELEDFIETRIEDADLKKNLLSRLSRVENDYYKMTDRLLKSANAGLNLIIVLHQLEKMVTSAKRIIENNYADNKLIDLVDTISKLISGYSLLVKRTDIKKQTVIDTINQSEFNVELRLKDHNIKLEYGPNITNNTKIEAIYSENYLLNCLMNLFDNSIWWLEYSQIEIKKIYIDIIKDQNSDFVEIIFADNGPGFSLSPEEMLEPFTTNKPNGTGIGLHLTNELMNSMKGKIKFPDWNDYDIPDTYKNGATIALLLNSNNKG